MERKRRGIDVSKWQGKIDWRKIASDDVHFAIIRIGYGSPDGSCTLDSYFHKNIRSALDNNINTGIYFYTYAQSDEAVRREAEWVIKELEPYRGRLLFPVAFDIEDESLERLNRSTNTDMTGHFCRKLEEAGYYAMYYTYLSFLENHLDYSRLSSYDLWLADYSRDRPSGYNYGIWQYTDDGRLDGTRGYTDFDHAFKDYPAIIRGNGLNGFMDSSDCIQAATAPAGADKIQRRRT